MQLRFLHVSGPNADPANVDFGPGLNVIHGPSNTGKSHILRLIDYALGARNPPEPIAEQALYDLVHLGVAMDDGSEKTLVRALQGGEIKVIEGLVKARPESKQGVAVSARHGARASLSKMLLEQLGAPGARIQTAGRGRHARSQLSRSREICADHGNQDPGHGLAGPDRAIRYQNGRDGHLQIRPHRRRRFGSRSRQAGYYSTSALRPRNWNCSIIKFANSTMKSPLPITTRRNWKSSIRPSMPNWQRVFRARKKPKAIIANLTCAQARVTAGVCRYRGSCCRNRHPAGAIQPARAALRVGSGSPRCSDRGRYALCARGWRSLSYLRRRARLIAIYLRRKCR